MQIRFVSLIVENQEHAHQFYTSTLGFEKMADIPMGEYRWLTAKSPDSINGVELGLEPKAISPVRTFQRAPNDAGIPATAFITTDIAAEFTCLNARGVKICGEPMKMERISAVMFEDTCGNLINLVQSPA